MTSVGRDEEVRATLTSHHTLPCAKHGSVWSSFDPRMETGVMLELNELDAC